MRLSLVRFRISRRALPRIVALALVLSVLFPSTLLAADSKSGTPTVTEMGNRGGSNYQPYARNDVRAAYRYNQRQYPVYGNGRYCNQYRCTQPSYSHEQYQYEDQCNSTRGNQSYYRVRRGDTLSAVARYYGVSVQSLAYANGLRNPHRIYAGQVLYIPTYGYDRR